ncbi:MAG: hypothetical protein IV093_13935 [Rubrivivax sp.]|nr:hypothetical protein [Rubrivivax sp.]
MNRHLFHAAGAAGLVAIGWVAAGYLPGSPLALGMTLLIAAFYAMGVHELWRYQQATKGLDAALGTLTAPPTALPEWLQQLPAPLQQPVRLRVAGDRVAFAGPALAPYLSGLLVLLGMLGTFLGMVVTLKGTGVAMAQAGDVNALRESLAAPVRGLGLAFGTSVAGVAGSAMLGLMSALCRRARQQAAQRLDAQIAGPLQRFGRAWLQAEQAAQARLEAQQQAQQQAREQAQSQAQLLQPLVERLQTLAEQLARQGQQTAEHLTQQSQHSAAKLTAMAEQTAGQLSQHGQQMAEQLSHLSQQTAAQLLATQQQVQAGHEQVFRELAAAVQASLQRSLSDSARLAADTLQPAVAATLDGITRETAALHGHISATVQQQLDGLAQRFEQHSSRWADTLGAQARQQAAALVQTLAEAQAQQSAQAAALGRMTEQTAALHNGLAERLAQQTHRWLDEAAARQQAQASTLLDMLAQGQATQMAAWEDVVTQLRGKLSESLAHDNSLLAERTQIMGTLHTLLGAVQHTSTEQKAAIDALVAASAHWLETAGARFTEQVNTESARLEAVAAQLGASAVDVASLGEAFGAAVGQFGDASAQVLAHLQRVEETLAKASTRSDEQLAYYVAQAREVIDLSLLSQKQIVEDLQRLARRQVAAASEAA